MIDGETRAKARTSLRRVDVMEAHRSAAGARCGFMFRIPINPGMLPASVQIRISGASGSTALGGRADRTLPVEAGMKRRSDLPSLDLRVPA